MTQEDEIEKLQVVLYQNPQSGQFVRLAELYLSREMATDAALLIQQSLKFNPQSVSGLILLGRSFRKLKKIDEAIEPLLQATKLAQDNWRAWLELAEIYLELRAIKLSLTAYKKVLLFNPTHPQARRAVAKLEVLTADEYEEDLFAMEKLPEANLVSVPETEITQSWEIAPDGLIRVISYVDALIVRNENQKAITLLNDCTKKYGTHPEIETRRLKLSVYEQAEFIKPKSLADSSKSRREMIHDKKIEVLQELLRRIESIKIESLST